jgi:hypothetical protein
MTPPCCVCNFVRLQIGDFHRHEISGDEKMCLAIIASEGETQSNNFNILASVDIGAAIFSRCGFTWRML